MTRPELLAALSDLAMQAAYVHDQQTSAVLRAAIAEIKSLVKRMEVFTCMCATCEKSRQQTGETK